MKLPPVQTLHLLCTCEPRRSEDKRPRFCGATLWRVFARRLLWSSGSSCEWLGKILSDDLRGAWRSFPVPAHWQGCVEGMGEAGRGALRPYECAQSQMLRSARKNPSDSKKGRLPSTKAGVIPSGDNSSIGLGPESRSIPAVSDRASISGRLMCRL